MKIEIGDDVSKNKAVNLFELLSKRLFNNHKANNDKLTNEEIKKANIKQATLLSYLAYLSPVINNQIMIIDTNKKILNNLTKFTILFVRIIF